MECYDIDDADWPRCLGLKRMTWNRRGARYGFPVRQIGRQLRVLLDRGMSVMLIREQRRYGNVIRERAPDWRYEAVLDDNH